MVRLGLLGMMTWLALGQPAMAERLCDRAVLINATAAEAEATCLELDKVQMFLRQLDHESTPALKLVFHDELVLPGSMTPVYGYFDSDLMEIHMVHLAAPQQAAKTALGVPWSESLAQSFLAHEIAHALIVASIGEREKQISHPWHEALAYFVQIELMDPTLREQVLNSTKGEFSALKSINSFTFGADPNSFAVKSYRSLQKWGGLVFLKSLLDGNIADAKPQNDGGF